MRSKPVFGFSLGGFGGKGFFVRPPDLYLPNDIVGGATLEAWAIVDLGRFELDPMIGCFWVTRWAGQVTGVGVGVGLRLRFAWDWRLSSGIGVAAGPGSFVATGAFEPGLYDSDSVFGHFTITLLALRVSAVLRLALDAAFTGWTHWYPSRALPRETEAAVWTRVSAEFVL